MPKRPVEAIRYRKNKITFSRRICAVWAVAHRLRASILNVHEMLPEEVFTRFPTAFLPLSFRG